MKGRCLYDRLYLNIFLPFLFLPVSDKNSLGLCMYRMAEKRTPALSVGEKRQLKSCIALWEISTNVTSSTVKLRPARLHFVRLEILPTNGGAPCLDTHITNILSSRIRLAGVVIIVLFFTTLLRNILWKYQYWYNITA